ncbi:MAG: hypothetical protein PHF79_02865 [Candidatus Pacebacteria bacterium]|nr:hypothetical protein [Candidatus Paceibacterota bacterium]
MRLQSHIIAGAVGAAATFTLWEYPYQALIFFVASFMIDADHYLDYLWKSKGKDWSPQRMFRYYDYVTENRYDTRALGFSLLHTVELFVLVYLLAAYVEPAFFLPVLAGMAYHMIFDMIWLTYHKIPFARAFSIIEYHVRKKQKHIDGHNVDHFYKEMFEKSEKKFRV